MTLYQDQTGPLVYYTGGTFGIEDLNPHTSARWRMSRLEMLVFGWRCIVAALLRE